MKKSKVLIPAMALLLFSTAASITGTVAWFTSTRTFTSEAGNFQVGSLDGNLACTLSAGVATAVDVDHAENLNLEPNSIIADASYDHVNESLYTDVAGDSIYLDLGAWNATTDDTSGAYHYADVGSPTVTHFYYAATWTMTFKYTFVAETTNMNLYFTANAATARITKSGSTTYDTNTAQPEAKTAQGFRIAFNSGAVGTGHKGLVWAPFRTQASPSGTATIRYINGVDEGSFGNYTKAVENGDLIDAGSMGLYATKQPNVNDPYPATDTNCIGVFTKPTNGGEVSLAVRCTAWFEGTDPSIVSDGAVMQAIKVSMPFHVRKAAA